MFDIGPCHWYLLNSAAFSVVPDILAVVDTFAVADSDFVHTAVVDIAADIAAAVGSSVVVARSTAVLGTAGTAVGFVGACLHPCKRGPLLWTACRNAPLFSFRPPALLPRASLGA